MIREQTGKKIVDFFLYLILATAIIFLIVNPKNLYPPTTLLLVFVLVLWVRKFFKPSNFYMALILLMAYLEIFGERYTLGFYHIFFYYDKFLHVIFGIIIFLFVFDLIGREKTGISKISNYLIGLFATMGLGAIWEIIEYSYDQIMNFNMKLQGVFSSGALVMAGLDDTMWDLICMFLGILFIILVQYLIKHFRKNKK
jgi:uncharacterized membrane protein YjdF